MRRNGRRVEIPSKELEKTAGKLSLANLRKVSAIAERAMKDHVHRVTSALITRHSARYSQGGGGPNLQRRSGQGLASIRSFTRYRKAGLEGVVTIPHAMATQEFGAVIRAKKSKYLTIPLPAALNPYGTPKERSARAWRKTFVVKGKRGLVVMMRDGRKNIPLYALRETVRIPARLGLRKELRLDVPHLKRDILMRVRELIRATS
jgi:hypothetical protein